MNIKTLLKLVIFLIILVSAIFSFLIYTNLNSYQQALKNYNTATNITYEIFQRRLVGDEYLINPGDRAKAQWFLKQAELKNIVSASQNSFISAKEKELITDISDNIGESESIFMRIIDISEKPPISTTSAELTRNALEADLSLKAQETITHAKDLAQINRDNTGRLLQEIIFLFSVVASLFFLMLFISFWVIARGVNQLDKSNERFNLVAKATHDAIYDWDVSSNHIWFNEGFQKLFKYKKADIQYSLDWWSEHIHHEDRARVDQQIDQVLRGSDDFLELEYRFRNGDGSFADVIDRAYLVRNKSGVAERYVGVMEDVTQRKIYEVELTKRTEEAERLNKITVDRELKMIELKQEIKKLTEKLQAKQ